MDEMYAFRWWVTMNKHFKVKSFDIRERRNYIKCSPERLVARKDYNSFVAIADLFANKNREYILFLAANNMYGFSDMIYDPATGIDNYNTFIMRIRYLSNVVETDFYHIARQCRKPIQPIDVLRLMTGGVITFESCVVLNKLRPGFFRKLEGTSIFSIVEPLVLRIEKASPFVKYDDSKRANFERLLDKLKLFC